MIRPPAYTGSRIAELVEVVDAQIRAAFAGGDGTGRNSRSLAGLDGLREQLRPDWERQERAATFADMSAAIPAPIDPAAAQWAAFDAYLAELDRQRRAA